jgi:hypothetical protein
MRITVFFFTYSVPYLFRWRGSSRKRKFAEYKTPRTSFQVHDCLHSLVPFGFNTAILATGGASSIVEQFIHARFIRRSPLGTGNLTAVNLCDMSERSSLPGYRRRFSRPLCHRQTLAGVIAASGTAAIMGAVAITAAARASLVASLSVH